LIDLGLEAEILTNLWKISLTKRQHIMQLLQGYEKGFRKNVLGALKNLADKGLIKITSSHLYFNPNRIEEIRKITGH
jgi:predicted transcriptional regulator